MPQAKPAPLRLPLLALALLAAALWLAGTLERADNALGDAMLRWHAAGRAPSDEIVLVAIDQHSLEGLNEIAGPWPWPRSVHGELIEGLARWRPKAVAFDVLFNEHDTFQPDNDLVLREIALTQDNLFFPTQRMPDGNPYPMHELPPSLGAVRTDPNAAGPGPVLVLWAGTDPTLQDIQKNTFDVTFARSVA